MALHPQKREDLLREAVAYARRLVIRLPSPEGPYEVFAGCRSGGAWSFYFGESPVMQFNSAGELRRLFIDDRKFVAQAGALVEFQRTASAGGRVLHQACRVPKEVEQQLLKGSLDRLVRLSAAVGAGDYLLVGQVPPAEMDSLGKLAEQPLWADFQRQLAVLSAGFGVASAAHVQGVSQ